MRDQLVNDILQIGVQLREAVSVTTAPASWKNLGAEGTARSGGPWNACLPASVAWSSSAARRAR